MYAMSFPLYAIVGTLGLMALCAYFGLVRLSELKLGQQEVLMQAREVRQWERCSVVIERVALGLPFYDPDLRPRGFTEAQNDPEALVALIKGEIKKAKAATALAARNGVQVRYRPTNAAGNLATARRRICPVEGALSREDLRHVQPGQTMSAYVSPGGDEVFLWAAPPTYGRRCEAAYQRVLLRICCACGVVLLASMLAVSSFH